MPQTNAHRPAFYASRAMIERRERVLRETLSMLRSDGLGAFRLSRLSERAGVATNTLRRTFGTREALVAAALKEKLVDQLQQGQDSPPRHLADQVERIISLAEDLRGRRSDLRALTALHFSPAASAELRGVTERVVREAVACWADRLDASTDLRPGIERADLVADLVRLELALLHDWSFGRLPDSKMPARLLRAWLALVAASTRGSVAAEATRQLQALDRIA